MHERSADAATGEGTTDEPGTTAPGTGAPPPPPSGGSVPSAVPSAVPPAAAAPPARRGPRRGVVVAVVAGAVAVGVGAAAALGAFDAPPTAPPPAPQVVVVPSPTPTIAPVAREPMSPFADALPASVLRYALTGVAEERSLLLAGALEGYRLDYADGADGAVTVLAGQWPTPEGATAAAAALAAGGTPVDDGGPTSGEVVAAGAPVGTWTLTGTADGLGALTWTNGSAVLQVLAPLDEIRDVYAALPL